MLTELACNLVTGGMDQEGLNLLVHLERSCQTGRPFLPLPYNDVISTTLNDLDSDTYLDLFTQDLAPVQQLDVAGPVVVNEVQLHHRGQGSRVKWEIYWLMLLGLIKYKRLQQLFLQRKPIEVCNFYMHSPKNFLVTLPESIGKYKNLQYDWMCHGTCHFAVHESRSFVFWMLY